MPSSDADRVFDEAADLFGLLSAPTRLRIVCAPQSLIQGHAAWHVLSALACACLYLRYEAAARASAPSVNPGSVESPAS